MINVTVKTLDSQNHQFNVDENLTVEQFKNHIAESVNIPATSQRIIYCGRVLQDTSKLSDYDVDGKVVHLVQRAPPSASTRNVRSLTPPPDLNSARTGFRGFDRAGNPLSHMYVGSMTLPQNLIEPQQVIPPRATYTLSSSRLNVARRMLQNAENVIRLLENPNGTLEQQAPTDETVEDEMTPVIEARVMVPTNGDQPIDENEIINAVQNTIFPSIGNLDGHVGPSLSSTSAEGPNDPQLSASAPETPRSASAENLSAEPNAENLRDSRRSGRRLRCRGTEMATLLTMLNQLQARFAPFLARYQTFMQDDPQVASEDLRETRLMLNRVSKVLHYLGHAYHSLSDIIIDVDQPPPRLLLCRPILIQPPTLVQAGIPIQLEAQISLSADRPSAPTPDNEAGSRNDNVSSSAPAATPTAPPTTLTPPEGNTAQQPSNGTQAQQTRPQPVPVGVGGNPPPGFVGLPIIPGGSMRVFTTPVEIRTVWPPNSQRGRPTTTNNNNNTAAAQNAPPPSAPVAPTANVESAGGNGGAATQDGPAPTQNPPFPVGAVPHNDGSMEFFMEVTPETFRGGNLLQNLMQMIGNQLAGATPETPQSAGNSQSNVHQSRARSTQTNPTTATHTRSTARPHVHMTQQAVQGGFDPFLHCYSHHVSQQSRPQRLLAVGPHLSRQDQTPASRDAGGAATPSPPNAPNASRERFNQYIASHIMSYIDNSLGDNVSQRLTNLGEPRGAVNPQAGPNINASVRRPTNVSEGTAPNTYNANQGAGAEPDFLNFLSSVFDQDTPGEERNGPTLDMYMQSFNADSFVEGESLIIDLIMLMLRDLRISDLFSISNGNLAPFERQLVAIQNFFLTQVCQNDTSDSGIVRATERIMADFAPIKDALESIPSKENIDMVRTIDGFFRQRVPPIIRLAINLRPRTEAGESRDAANFVANIWSATRDLLTLAVHCSANGQEGVQNACNEVLMSTFFNNRSVPNELHRWTVSNSRSALNSILSGLNSGTSHIEQYVVQKSPVSEQHERSSSSNEPLESMEVDYSPNLVAAESVPIEDPEPLPNVIWGSESWHGQTPEDWVPIITRDVQKQRRQEVQPPFSDAYLAGMPSKRRKLISNSKPEGNLPQVISESVRQVVSSAGLSTAAPLDVVAQEASESLEIQTAYRNLLQATVQNNLRNNEDFDPERYPNAAHYFSESSAPE